MSRNKYKIIRNLAFILIVFNSLYWFFPVRPIVWRLGLVFLALYVDMGLEGKKLPCEKTILVFTILNLVYFFISFLYSPPSFTQIGNILCAMLTFSLFVFLAQKDVMDEKFFTIVGFVLLLAAILYYYQYLTMLRNSLNLDSDSDITNNGAGIFMFLMPMLFLMKNKYQKWITFVVCLFYIIMGAKRGYIVAVAIPAIMFVFHAFKDNRRSLFKSIGVIIIAGAVGFFVYRMASDNDYLMYRWNQTLEGDSSGRDLIYSNIWDGWKDSANPLNMLFGYGFDATSEIGAHAHSDWLEILYDYGLFGVAIYLLLFLQLFRMIPKIKSSNMKMTYIASIILWLLPSIYSMGFTSGSMAILMISMGTALGNYKKEVFYL